MLVETDFPLFFVTKRANSLRAGRVHEKKAKTSLCNLLTIVTKECVFALISHYFGQKSMSHLQ